MDFPWIVLIIVALIIFALSKLFSLSPEEKDFYSRQKSGGSININSFNQSNYTRELRVFVAGVHLANRRNHILNKMIEGVEVLVEPDPENRHDSNAIAVKDKDYGKIIGYIPADKTARVLPIIQGQYNAIIDEILNEASYSHPGEQHLTVYIKIFHN